MSGDTLAYIVVGFFIACTAILCWLCWTAPEIPDPGADNEALARALGLLDEEVRP